MPLEYQKYIESWRSYCPDYEIKKWDETNFDIHCCEYVYEAYQAKKWAFVSDYARFKILYEYGGVYFDTDVELIKSIDEILENGPFMGIEVMKEKNVIATGLGLASNPRHELYKEILEQYDKIHFRNEDGSLNQKTVVEYVTEILTIHGWENKNSLQNIKGINIYPSDYFGPMNCLTGEICITNNTISIHHYSGSWLDNKHKAKNIVKKMAGPKLTSLVIKIKNKLREKEND